MRIITQSQYEEQIRPITQAFPNCGLYGAWKKAFKIINLATSILFLLLALFTFHKYKYFILKMLNTKELDVSHRIIVALASFSLIIFIVIIFTVLHETIHIISNYKSLRKSIIVLSLPMAISVAGDEWQPRNLKLKILIAPFIVLTALILLLCFFVHESLFILWLFLINTALSSADIFAFFYIYKNVPADAFMFEHYVKGSQ